MTMLEQPVLRRCSTTMSVTAWDCSFEVKQGTVTSIHLAMASAQRTLDWGSGYLRIASAVWYSS